MLSNNRQAPLDEPGYLQALRQIALLLEKNYARSPRSSPSVLYRHCLPLYLECMVLHSLTLRWRVDHGKGTYRSGYGARVGGCGSG